MRYLPKVYKNIFVNLINIIMFRKERGFTLIELLVVIAIIGILSSVVLASLNSARQKSRDARRVSDIKQLQVALELSFDSDGNYPAALADLVTDGFMAAVPQDPGSNAYTYVQITSGSDYLLRAQLEGQNSALNSDLDGTIASTDCADATFFYCVQP